jgi:hypothetical protein
MTCIPLRLALPLVSFRWFRLAVGLHLTSDLVEEHGYVVGGELRVGLFAGADSDFG